MLKKKILYYLTLFLFVILYNFCYSEVHFGNISAIKDKIQQLKNKKITSNHPPIINSLTANPLVVSTGGVSIITCVAFDEDADTLEYVWTATGGTISAEGPTINWTAPLDSTGTYTITCKVNDSKGAFVQKSVDIIVVPKINHQPVIDSLTASPIIVSTDGVSVVTCVASDSDGDTLSYFWSTTGGIILGSGSQINWTAPSSTGTYIITCTISDGQGGTDQKSVIIEVGITVVSGGVWTKQWGTTLYDEGIDVGVDTSGNIYVTGRSGGYAGGVGGYDVFLKKYASDGTELWAKKIGSATSNDEGYSIAIDSSGNIYVTGTTNGGVDGFQNFGGYDVFLTKYDSLGNKLWTKQWGSSSDDYGKSVAIDNSGNIYVLGSTRGSIDGKTNYGGFDIFLTKYNSSGEYLGTIQWGSSSDDYAYGISVDTLGNIYVTGYTWGGLDGNINFGGYDVFLTKYLSLTNKLWTKQWGSSSNDYGYSVALDNSGNIFVTGSISGNVFLAKYSTNGELLWERQLGSSSSVEYGYSISIDNSGNIYVTGSTNGEVDGNLSAGRNDIFLTKYTSDGTKLWTKQWGTPLDDCGYSVAVDNLGNIYVTGFTSGGLDWNENYGGYDIFLTKFEQFSFSWNDVNDFVYQLQNIDLEAIGNTKFDLVVIDYSSDGTEEGRFTAEQINVLKNSPGGPKLVLSYMSIGEAETYRWYWNPNWDANNDGIPDSAAPTWLGPSNPEWPDNYKVKYWEPGWQSIVFQYLDKIIEAGFDGVYLDIIDAYEYWGPGGESGLERQTAEQEMVDFVRSIANYARVTKGKTNFGVFPQNGEALALHPEYLEVVTGIGREDTWYNENTPNPTDHIEYVLYYLDIFKQAGKLVLVIDYVTQQNLIDDFYSKAQVKGYIPYATVRMLDKITINPGHEPD